MPATDLAAPPIAAVPAPGWPMPLPLRTERFVVVLTVGAFVLVLTVGAGLETRGPVLGLPTLAGFLSAVPAASLAVPSTPAGANSRGVGTPIAFRATSPFMPGTEVWRWSTRRLFGVPTILGCFKSGALVVFLDPAGLCTVILVSIGLAPVPLC